MRQRRRVGPLVTAVACAVSLAACGSTATLSNANGGNAGNGAGSGLGFPGASSASGTVPAAGGAVAANPAGNGLGTPAAAAGSGAGGSAGGGGAAVAAGGVGPSRASGPAGSQAPGVTATTISIGYPYEVNGAAANKAIGGNGITQGDEQGEANALINLINSHGGILGRKIVPVWFPVDVLSTATADSQDQSICSAFEQDHHVFAIIDGGNPILEACAQRAGAVSFWDDLSVSSARTFAQYPSYFELSMMDLNRIVVNEASALAAQHYFNPWDANLSRPAGPGSSTKVGIIAYDTPDFHYAVDGFLLPQLSRLGHAPASGDVVYVPEPQNESDVGPLSADVSNAVLKFRTNGVEHVLIVDATGVITLEFLNNAESQHYFPRYGWSSQNGPQALVGPGDIPKDQLNGSQGIGFDPMLDLPSASNPDNGPYSSANRRACLTFLRSKGYSFSDPNAESVALGICTSLSFLQAAITAGGPTITQSSFIAGANRLGYWSGDADGPSNYFGSNQHDGTASYRYYDWNSSCGCMQYTSGPVTAVGEGEH